MTAFEPHTWQPLPAPPLKGELEQNDALASSSLWATPEGPEDIVIDGDGSAIVGVADGRLLRVTPDTVEVVADVGGRPLGIEWYGEDEVIVCNAYEGLQKVTRSGEVTTLARGFDGADFMFTNNAAVASSGAIYFSDTSTRWQIAEYVNDLLEGQRTGRVFRWDPDGTLTRVMDGLQFANGVALDPGEQSFFVAETGTYRVHRHWIAGDREGETDLFLDNLPGFPDNLTLDDGILWVSLASPRQKAVDLMAPRAWMRSLSFRLPESLKPKPVRHGIVLGYDMEGHLVHNLQDTSGKVAITTSARAHDGRLFIGSLSEPHVAVYEL